MPPAAEPGLPTCYSCSLGWRPMVSSSDSDSRSEANAFAARDDLNAPLLAVQAIGLGLTVISFCLLFDLHFYSHASHLREQSGGILGQLLAQLLLPALSYVGTTISALALALFGLTLIIEISWLSVIDRIGAMTLERAIGPGSNGHSCSKQGERRGSSRRKSKLARKPSNARLSMRRLERRWSFKSERTKNPKSVSERRKKSRAISSKLKALKGCLRSTCSMKLVKMIGEDCPKITLRPCRGSLNSS